MQNTTNKPTISDQLQDQLVLVEESFKDLDRAMQRAKMDKPAALEILHCAQFYAEQCDKLEILKDQQRRQKSERACSQEEQIRRLQKLKTTIEDQVRAAEELLPSELKEPMIALYQVIIKRTDERIRQLKPDPAPNFPAGGIHHANGQEPIFNKVMADHLEPKPHDVTTISYGEREELIRIRATAYELIQLMHFYMNPFEQLHEKVLPTFKELRDICGPVKPEPKTPNKHDDPAAHYRLKLVIQQAVNLVKDHGDDKIRMARPLWTGLLQFLESYTESGGTLPQAFGEEDQIADITVKEMTNLNILRSKAAGVVKAQDKTFKTEYNISAELFTAIQELKATLEQFQ